MGTMASPALRAFTQPCVQAKINKKNTSKLRVTGLCTGNSPVTGEFHAQMASNAENVSIWWSHQVVLPTVGLEPMTYQKCVLN